MAIETLRRLHPTVLLFASVLVMLSDVAFSKSTPSRVSVTENSVENNYRGLIVRYNCTKEIASQKSESISNFDSSKAFVEIAAIAQREQVDIAVLLQDLEMAIHGRAPEIKLELSSIGIVEFGFSDVHAHWMFVVKWGVSRDGERVGEFACPYSLDGEVAKASFYLQSILENVCYEEEDAFIIRRQLTSTIELPRMNESDAKEPTTIQFIADTTLAARIEERVNNALLNLPTNDGVKINRITCHDLRSARIRGLGFFLVARMIVDNDDLSGYPLFLNRDKTIPVIELQQGNFTKPAASVSDFVTGEDFDPTQPIEEYFFNELRVGFYIPVISLDNNKDSHFANCATPKETFEAAEQVREYWEEFLNSFRQQTMNVFVPVTLKIRSIELVNHPTARIWYFRVVWRTVSNDGFPGSFFALFSTDAKQWRHEISFHETVPDIASMAGVSADLQTNLVLEKLTDNATKDDEPTIESRSEDAWQQVVNNQIQIALGKFSGDSKINWQVSEIRKVKLAHVGVVYRIELQTDDPLWDGHKNHFYFGQNGRVPSMIAKWRLIPNAEVPLR